MKEAAVFIAGAVSSELVILLAIGRPVVLLSVGFTLALALAVTLLWLCGIRRVARVLNAIADAWTPGRAQSPRVVPSLDNSLENDVASALMNQGTREKIARQVASQAVRENREFDPAFRAALQLIPSRRRNQ